MFPRGSRFAPEIISDVPGPGEYNTDQEYQESYKRGAFLEKADRFTTQTMSDAPGPGAYTTDAKKPAPKATTKRTSPPQNDAERCTALQRKVVDLERVHNEGKKSHQAEIERLKLDLARLQKANNELTDRVSKQAKHKDALDQRIEDLKKASISDKAEIKDLGVKLRMSEHQRAKHGDILETKKALQALELRRKDELKERDKAISDLEKNLAAEKKRKEALEGQMKESKVKGEAEVGKLKAEVTTARSEAQTTQALLKSTQLSEASFSAQLDAHRTMLSTVTGRYSLLASSTVPKQAYDFLRTENMVLHLQAARSARKLGNTEGQVLELAHLIRQSREENHFLCECIRVIEEELQFYVQSTKTITPEKYYDSSLDHIIMTMDRDQESFEQEIREVTATSLELQRDFYHIAHEDLLSLCTATSSSLAESTETSSALAIKLTKSEEERDTAQALLAATTLTAETLKASSEAFKRQVEELEERVRKDEIQAEENLTREKNTVHRLTTTVQKARMAEDGLRAEIEQLTAELTAAERFQEAYYSLSEELDGLVARNALAEDEAKRLSTVNAEILGHQNPAQRIMYVEKIRNELAETKQRLLVSTRTRENIAAENQDLQNELDMYKSVAVPYEMKPRTNMTRLARPPLVNLNKSMSVGPGDRTYTSSNSDSNSKPQPPVVRVFDSIDGDMTLDEIY